MIIFTEEFSYSAFTVAKSFKSFTKTVVLMMLATLKPACSKIALTFSSAWRACSVMSADTSPVLGLTGI